jgi:osmotically-inducible protein OsmY
MKTDMQVQKDVIDELHWDPSVSDAEIAVAAKDGVVTLAGAVKSYAQKYAAERAAERVIGVKAIAEEIEVKPSRSFSRSDTEIAHAVTTALLWDVEVPDDTVKATVEDGRITLTGSVEWKFQKDAAEHAVRNLSGVKGVRNLLQVKPKHVSTVEVRSRIREALRRSADRDADHVIVEASDGHVTLKGSVRSFAERADAERAAWSAPGVSMVVDRIVVQ